MDRTILNVIASQALPEHHIIIKQALKDQFGNVKHQLTKNDWQEINFMSLFLTVSIFRDAGRIARLQEDDISQHIMDFLDSEVDHIDDTIQMNQRMTEYLPLFNPLSPTPFCAISSSFLEHLSIEDDNSMMPCMLWMNNLYMNMLEQMVLHLSPKKTTSSNIKIQAKTGGSGCLTLIACALVLLALFLLL